MADFDPDAFLAEGGGSAVAEFDPDKFLAEPVPFDPDAFLAEGQPQSSAVGDFAKRVPAGIASATAQIGQFLLYGEKKLSDVGLGALGPGAGILNLARMSGAPVDSTRGELRDIQDRAAADYGVDPARDDQFASKVASGIGSIVPIIASGPAAPLTAAALMGEGQRQDAEAHGAGEGAQLAAAGLGAGVGLLSEALMGLPQLMRVAKGIVATAPSTARAIGEQALRTAGREGTQEALEQTAQNLIANTAVGYDPERETSEGVGTALMVGATVGGPIGATTQAAVSIDQKTAAAQAPVQPPLAPLTVTEDEISTGPAPADSVVAEPAPAIQPTKVPKLEVRDSPDNVTETMQANGKTAGAKIETVNIDTLSGGVDMKQPKEQKRVDALAEKMTGDDGHIARLIVDAEGTVVEGQHRLEALRKLGIKDVPVVKIFGVDDFVPDVDALKKVLTDAGVKGSDSRNRITDIIGEILMDENGSVADLRDYEAPKGHEKAWKAAIDEVLRQKATETTLPEPAAPQTQPTPAQPPPVPPKQAPPAAPPVDVASATLGTTPSGDKEFIRIPGALKRLTQGLEREGSADVIGRTKNVVGQQLSQAIRKHVDTEQEVFAKTSQPLTKALAGVPRVVQDKAFDEVETYLAAKENGRPLPKLTATAQKLVTAWEDIAEQSGLLAEQNDVQVFDATTGTHRPMHRIGRAYVPRMFKPEVQRVLTDPQSNPELFRDLATALSEHRGITLDEAATELRGEAGRFQANDFMGNLEMARTGQLPELFYDYDVRRLASRYIPAFSERMAQIMSYGQRLGPRDAPTRPNLWDAARSEAEGAYTQNYLREAEDQSANLKSRTGFVQIARKGQAIASGLLLSNPFTTIPRNVLSGVTSTAELLGAWNSAKTLREAATSAQAKMDAKEIGATRDQIAGFLHADEMGQSWGDEAVRAFTDTLLTFSGYSGSEVFVRTHAALTAAQFAKDGVSAIQKNPASSRAKEALGLFQRMGVDPQAIVSEGADWKTGDKTREFIRTVIRDTQGGYRFDQVPLWAGSSVGRWAYQLGRWGTQRARNIWKNGIKPMLGETVEWNGKKMVRYDAGPFLKMIGSTVLLGEAFAGIAALFFDRDRKDATLQEIREAWSDDEGKAVGLALERVVNDIVMAGTLGIWGQPVDFMKSYKDQSRLKNPAEPPALAWGKAAIDLFEDYVDQEGTVTTNDLLKFSGSVWPGAKQGYQVARNVLDEPLYEAQNDVSTLRASASRWARTAGLDVPKRAAMDFRKGPNSPQYEAIQEALLVGNADRAKTLASEFVAKQRDRGKAMTALRTSVKGKQPFRVGPFTNTKLRTDFMSWAKTNLPKQDLEQVKRVQERYEASARKAGLW